MLCAHAGSRRLVGSEDADEPAVASGAGPPSGTIPTAQCVAKFEAAMRSPGCAAASAAGVCTAACEAEAATVPAECMADAVLTRLALAHTGLVADM